MQEAIEATMEMKERLGGADPVRTGELKPEINNLLHMFLPGEITVKEAEILGMVIFEIVTDPRRFLDAK